MELINKVTEKNQRDFRATPLLKPFDGPKRADPKVQVKLEPHSDSRKIKLSVGVSPDTQPSSVIWRNEAPLANLTDKEYEQLITTMAEQATEAANLRFKGSNVDGREAARLAIELYYVWLKDHNIKRG